MTTYILMCLYKDADPVTKACVNSAIQELGLKLHVIRNVANVDMARALLVKQALSEPDCDRVLFIDSDVAFGPAQIAKLLSHDKDIVALPYVNRHDKVPALQLLPAFYAEPVETRGITFGPGDRPLLRIRGAGTGCLAITRKVFETMAPFYQIDHLGLRAWFACGVFWDDALKDYAYYSDDYSFCARAREAGFELWCDTSEPILHYSSVDKAWLNIFGGAIDPPEVVKE